MDEILKDKDFSTQLKNISVEDLLARNPKDLDKAKKKGRNSLQIRCNFLLLRWCIFALHIGTYWDCT